MTLMQSDDLETALSVLTAEYSGTAVRPFALLLDELARWNRRVNLTAIREPGDMITGHLLDSLVARPLLEGNTVLDFGTGAGFPGLPLAISEPERNFHLVDANNKKIMFVQHAATRLGLANVRPVHARVQDYAPGHPFDTVICRAVAAVPKLLEIAGHHVGEDGVFVAMKGKYPAEELESLPSGWTFEVTELDVPGLPPGSRHAVLLRRAT